MVLHAFGGGHYGCDHVYFAPLGLVIAGGGWLGLLAALRGVR